ATTNTATLFAYDTFGKPAAGYSEERERSRDTVRDGGRAGSTRPAPPRLRVSPSPRLRVSRPATPLPISQFLNFSIPQFSSAKDFRKISPLFSSHLHFQRPLPIDTMRYDVSRALANVLRLVGVPARQAADRRSICEPGRACRSSSRVRRNPARPGEERDGIHRWMMWLTLHGEDLSGMHHRLGSTQWDWASIS